MCGFPFLIVDNTPTQKMDAFNHCQNWRKLMKSKEKRTSNY